MTFGIGMMAIVHGVNDRWASGWPLVGIAACLLFVVIGYAQNGDRIEAEVDHAAATTAAGGVVFPARASGAAHPDVATPQAATGNGLIVPARYQQTV